MIKCKIKKLVDSAVIPTKGTNGSAVFDLIATSVEVSDEKISYAYMEYGTGLSVEIPSGYVGLIYPRSSISNTGMILANSVGVIDSDYRGEIKLRFKYIKDSAAYEVGDRIGQIMFVKLPSFEFDEVDSLNETDHGDGGFGSTGN